MAIQKITPQQLEERLAGNTPIQILDPLTEQHFASLHIPQAINLCVYETAFEEKAPQKLKSDLTTIVYGLNDSFEAAELAAQKLAKLGFGDVRILSGGIEAWSDAGLAIESDQHSASPPNGNFSADLSKSHLRWVGRNLFSQHNGTIAIQAAEISFSDGQPTSGNIVLDMQAIECHDITDSKLNKMLLAHLANNDFFLTEKFPTASFTLKSIEPLPKATYGKPNYTLSGEATIRGERNPVTAAALVGWSEESISVQGQFELDRTHFGSKYGSGRFYEALGMHLVNDFVSVSFQLTFSR